jgi:RNA polymerase sigma-70 factor (ECF subfamily)
MALTLAAVPWRERHRLSLHALEQVRCQFETQTWNAFWQTAVEGRSPPDLTAELGMSPAAIRQAKSRVLRRLKQEMHPHHLLSW